LGVCAAWLRPAACTPDDARFNLCGPCHRQGPAFR